MNLLLWRLQGPTRKTTDCYVSKLITGNYELRLVRNGDTFATEVYRTRGEAVTRATEFAIGLTARGWTEIAEA